MTYRLAVGVENNILAAHFGQRFNYTARGFGRDATHARRARKTRANLRDFSSCSRRSLSTCASFSPRRRSSVRSSSSSSSSLQIPRASPKHLRGDAGKKGAKIERGNASSGVLALSRTVLELFIFLRNLKSKRIKFRAKIARARNTVSGTLTSALPFPFFLAPSESLATLQNCAWAMSRTAATNKCNSQNIKINLVEINSIPAPAFAAALARFAALAARVICRRRAVHVPAQNKIFRPPRDCTKNKN